MTGKTLGLKPADSPQLATGHNPMLVLMKMRSSMESQKNLRRLGKASSQAPESCLRAPSWQRRVVLLPSEYVQASQELGFHLGMFRLPRNQAWYQSVGLAS